MTTTNLMSHNISTLSRMQITVSDAENASRSLSDSPQAESSQAESSQAESIGVAQFCTLPYQASHQVELLHLHAEIESLRQQVRTLKQQRLADGEDLLMESSEESNEVPALSLR